jgi:prepilin-type N-terminal cleavage/methylation domain-containing protein/prepilin-type processing-associated H-X9-DG protein
LATYYANIRTAALVTHRAFTIVEMLVVMGIIAVLISLLMPSLEKSRQSSVAVLCESNLRQIGMALNIYADRNQDHYPTWSSWEVYPNGSSSEDDNSALGWTEQIMPGFVAPTNAIYRCPAFPQQAQINYFLETRWLYVHSPTLPCLKRSDITRSSVFILGGDCTGQELYGPPFGINLTHPTTSDCDKTDEGVKCLVFKNELGGVNIHPNGNNVLFADNHVEAFQKYDSQKMTYSPHRMQDWTDITPE